MKIITRNLMLFALLLCVYTLLFRYGLSKLLPAEAWKWLIVISSLYGIMIAVTAYLAGRRDGKENFLFDAGFRWSLTTFIVWGATSEAWFLLGLQSRYETIRTVHITLLIWSFFLILHLILFLILRRRTIRGIHKTDIFE
jgi:L-asparagine transporter-like permease